MVKSSMPFTLATTAALLSDTSDGTTLVRCEPEASEEMDWLLELSGLLRWDAMPANGTIVTHAVHGAIIMEHTFRHGMRTPRA